MKKWIKSNQEELTKELISKPEAKITYIEDDKFDKVFLVKIPKPAPITELKMQEMLKEQFEKIESLINESKSKCEMGVNTKLSDLDANLKTEIVATAQETLTILEETKSNCESKIESANLKTQKMIQENETKITEQLSILLDEKINLSNDEIIKQFRLDTNNLLSNLKSEILDFIQINKSDLELQKEYEKNFFNLKEELILLTQSQNEAVSTIIKSEQNESINNVKKELMNIIEKNNSSLLLALEEAKNNSNTQAQDELLKMLDVQNQNLANSMKENEKTHLAELKKISLQLEQAKKDNKALHKVAAKNIDVIIKKQVLMERQQKVHDDNLKNLKNIPQIKKDLKILKKEEKLKQERKINNAKSTPSVIN